LGGVAGNGAIARQQRAIEVVTGIESEPSCIVVERVTPDDGRVKKIGSL
jgi:hypothetical protein